MKPFCLQRLVWEFSHRSEWILLQKWFSTRVISHSADIWQYLKTFLVVRAVDVPMASSGQRPELLLNVLPCTGQPPMTKNYPAQMSVVLKLCNPVLEKYRSHNTCMYWALMFCIWRTTCINMKVEIISKYFPQGDFFSV